MGPPASEAHVPRIAKIDPKMAPSNCGKVNVTLHASSVWPSPDDSSQGDRDAKECNLNAWRCNHAHHLARVEVSSRRRGRTCTCTYIHDALGPAKVVPKESHIAPARKCHLRARIAVSSVRVG